MIKVLVCGSSGQLGQEIQSIAANFENLKFVFADKDVLDITNEPFLQKYFASNSFDYVVNCAAYTAVDKAESDSENAFLVNQTACKHLANACKLNHVKLISISTDFVFDGNKSTPYVETDCCNPLGVYGESKLKGEEEIVKAMRDFIIIRTSWLYSSLGNNFLKTMMRLGKERTELNVVFDQIGTPTYAADLASAICEIMSEGKFISGIYHYSNEGVASWYDFAVEIMKMNHLNCKVHPILAVQYPTPAKRPHFSVLDKSKFKSSFSIQINHWKESLINCITRINCE